MYEKVTCENKYLSAEAFCEIVSDDIYVDFTNYKVRFRKEFLKWHREIHFFLNSDNHKVVRWS